MSEKYIYQFESFEPPSTLFFSCKPIHPPDNDSMSLKGTEAFRWTDHWICAAWLTVNQYLTPTLGQDRGDRAIQHRANYYLMKACPGLGCKQNRCKTEVLCLGCWSEPLQQQHSPHSETRPRHTRYGNSCIRKFCKWCLFSTWFHFFITQCGDRKSEHRSGNVCMPWTKAAGAVRLTQIQNSTARRHWFNGWPADLCCGSHRAAA